MGQKLLLALELLKIKNLEIFHTDVSDKHLDRFFQFISNNSFFTVKKTVIMSRLGYYLGIVIDRILREFDGD